MLSSSLSQYIPSKSWSRKRSNRVGWKSIFTQKTTLKAYQSCSLIWLRRETWLILDASSVRLRCFNGEVFSRLQHSAFHGRFTYWGPFSIALAIQMITRDISEHKCMGSRLTSFIMTAVYISVQFSIMHLISLKWLTLV